jgi:hypothetical protein
MIDMTHLVETTITESAVRPFHVSVPDEDLVDLRRRIVATRWSDRESVTDSSGWHGGTILGRAATPPSLP